jgi:cell division protein FtsB
MRTSSYPATDALENEFSGSNPVSGLFLWASKTDRRILRMCAPWTQMTHISRGFFVVETALFAAGAAYYTLITTVSSNGTAAFIIALLWGAMILMIDRELVGAWSRRSLWIRVLLAAVIGMTVAIPAEMRVLQGRIDQQIVREQQQENGALIARYHAQQDQLDQREQQLQAQIADFRNQSATASRNKEAESVGAVIAGETTGIRGEGPAYHAANDRIRELGQQMDAASAEVKEIETARTRIATEMKNEEIGAVYDFPSRYEALTKATDASKPLWRLAWLITLVFIGIDMVPVLMKALSPVTDYDHLLATQVKENIYRARLIAEHNSQAMEDEFLTRRANTIDTYEQLTNPEIT